MSPIKISFPAWVVVGVGVESGALDTVQFVIIIIIIYYPHVQWDKGK